MTGRTTPKKPKARWALRDPRLDHLCWRPIRKNVYCLRPDGHTDVCGPIRPDDEVITPVRPGADGKPYKPVVIEIPAEPPVLDHPDLIDLDDQLD